MMNVNTFADGIGDTGFDVSNMIRKEVLCFAHVCMELVLNANVLPFKAALRKTIEQYLKPFHRVHFIWYVESGQNCSGKSNENKKRDKERMFFLTSARRKVNSEKKVKVS